jgi:hypothetical protein
MLSALVKRIGGKHYSLDRQLDFIGGQAFTGRRLGVGRGVLFEFRCGARPAQIRSYDGFRARFEATPQRIGILWPGDNSRQAVAFIRFSQLA